MGLFSKLFASKPADGDLIEALRPLLLYTAKTSASYRLAGMPLGYALNAAKKATADMSPAAQLAFRKNVEAVYNLPIDRLRELTDSSGGSEELTNEEEVPSRLRVVGAGNWICEERKIDSLNESILHCPIKKSVGISEYRESKISYVVELQYLLCCDVRNTRNVYKDFRVMLRLPFQLASGFYVVGLKSSDVGTNIKLAMEVVCDTSKGGLLVHKPGTNPEEMNDLLTMFLLAKDIHFDILVPSGPIFSMHLPQDDGFGRCFAEAMTKI